MMREEIIQSLKNTQEFVFACSEKTILPPDFNDELKQDWQDDLDKIEDAFENSFTKNDFSNKIASAESTSLDGISFTDEKVNQLKVKQLIETKLLLQGKLKKIREEIASSKDSITEKMRLIEIGTESIIQKDNAV